METSQIIALIKTLRADDDAEHDMNLSMVQALLLVYQHDGISQRELSQLMDITPPVLSRIIASLSPQVRRQGKVVDGRNLIEQRQDEADWRRKTLHLTQKGKRLIEQLEAV